MHQNKNYFDLLKIIDNTLNNKRLLEPNLSILLSISGGQDSVCLFFLFEILKIQWNWNISIVYCNHLWQKESFKTQNQICKIGYFFNNLIYVATFPGQTSNWPVVMTNKYFLNNKSRYIEVAKKASTLQLINQKLFNTNISLFLEIYIYEPLSIFGSLYICWGVSNKIIIIEFYLVDESPRHKLININFLTPLYFDQRLFINQRFIYLDQRLGQIHPFIFTNGAHLQHPIIQTIGNLNVKIWRLNKMLSFTSNKLINKMLKVTTSFTEQKSRNWRYELWQKLSFFYEYKFLITGHTTTDRVETLLLNLVRGRAKRE
uniref:Hypothetical chloroplast RF62 n=1 Tax=Pleurastrum terricola TaxID=34116 RepID=A6YG61_PLETE|nr:hypothetical chloroplast RF62 [Pleurastrum terricola]ABO69283.1 hypothetical chloroplast RF62 [Pleurastrum terricola]